LWKSKYKKQTNKTKTNVISTLNKLVEAIRKGQFYSSAQFKLVKIKTCTCKYILLGTILQVNM